MRKFLIAAVAVSAFAFSGIAVNADDAKGKSVKGVLIDTTCGAKQMEKGDPEKSAAAHPKSCAIKCGEGGGYALVSGKKMMKLDAKGNELAGKYLAVDANATQVVIMGTPSEDGTTLAVTSIEPAGEKSDGEKGAGKEG